MGISSPSMTMEMGLSFKTIPEYHFTLYKAIDDE